jgi:arachidonate 5-lipoxygenase
VGSALDAAHTRMSVAHAPPSLAIIPAHDLDDYNSLNYMRAKSSIAKHARILVYKLGGLRKQLPDQRAPI